MQLPIWKPVLHQYFVTLWIIDVWWCHCCWIVVHRWGGIQSRQILPRAGPTEVGLGHDSLYKASKLSKCLLHISDAWSGVQGFRASPKKVQSLRLIYQDHFWVHVILTGTSTLTGRLSCAGVNWLKGMGRGREKKKWNMENNLFHLRRYTD